MTTPHYTRYLQVTEDGHIWWLREDAIRLGAGFLPAGNDNWQLDARLQPPHKRALTIERTLIGALSDLRSSIPKPLSFELGSFFYIDAISFLDWLSQYVSQQHAEIDFPDDLAIQVQMALAKAAAEQPPIPPDEFLNLAVALEGHYESPKRKLPNALRKRVQRLFLAPWHRLSPNQRRSIAEQSDYLHDPATKAAREAQWNLLQKTNGLRNKINEWEKTETPTATDRALKETRLKELHQELEQIQQQDYRKPKLKQGSIEQVECVPAASTKQDSNAGLPNFGNSDACAVFRQMVDLRPDELSMAIVGNVAEEGLSGNGMLEISARGTTRRLALAEFGLVDRRSGALNRQAAVLVGLAHGEKIMRNEEKHAATMKRLRTEFRNRLGVSADPFIEYDSTAGWQPKFSIFDLRGLADERARRTAERKTLSFEQQLDQGRQFPSTHTNDDERDQDDADRWLKENDPHHST